MHSSQFPRARRIIPAKAPAAAAVAEAEERFKMLTGARAAAEAAIDVSPTNTALGYEKAVACLTKDRDAMLAFFDFPAEHWDHLRTSNPIESVFATVRHRTVRTKGALSAKTANRRDRASGRRSEATD
jgi:transposase-like protein